MIKQEKLVKEDPKFKLLGKILDQANQIRRKGAQSAIGRARAAASSQLSQSTKNPFFSKKLSTHNIRTSNITPNIDLPMTPTYKFSKAMKSPVFRAPSHKDLIKQRMKMQQEERQAQKMVAIKQDIRDCQRDASMCVKSMTQLMRIQQNKIQVIKGRSETFQLVPFTHTIAVIENMRKKPQPMVIRIHGAKGELFTYVSTSHQYPNHENHQRMFQNQREIVYVTDFDYMKPRSQSPSQKDGKNHNTSQTVRFMIDRLYCTLETTEKSPNVSITVQFG